MKSHDLEQRSWQKKNDNNNNNNNNKTNWQTRQKHNNKKTESDSDITNMEHQKDSRKQSEMCNVDVDIDMHERPQGPRTRSPSKIEQQSMTIEIFPHVTDHTKTVESCIQTDCYPKPVQ